MAKTKFDQLVAMAANLEMGKSNAKVGDVRQIMSTLGMHLFQERQASSTVIYDTLLEIGKKRAKKEQRKK